MKVTSELWFRCVIKGLVVNCCSYYEGLAAFSHFDKNIVEKRMALSGKSKWTLELGRITALDNTNDCNR
ncbi:hypothetical protein [Marivirga sp.]|uniref:hypothetical protein n=1 Tax=Marivirga sp. TaxID=2018662 RepID=UPI003DA79CC1